MTDIFEESPPEEIPDSRIEIIEPEDDAPYGLKADGTPRAKPGRKTGSSGGGSSGSKKSVSLANLEAEVADALGGDLAASIGTVAPLVAWVLTERADRTARALSRIAQRNPRFKDALVKALSYRDYVALAALPPALAVASMIEFGLLNHESMMSKRFGLDHAYEMLYGDETTPGSEAPPDFVPTRAIGLLA